jgi:hypothetical protein
MAKIEITKITARNLLFRNGLVEGGGNEPGIIDDTI